MKCVEARLSIIYKEADGEVEVKLEEWTSPISDRFVLTLTTKFEGKLVPELSLNQLLDFDDSAPAIRFTIKAFDDAIKKIDKRGKNKMEHNREPVENLDIPF